MLTYAIVSSICNGDTHIVSLHPPVRDASLLPRTHLSLRCGVDGGGHAHQVHMGSTCGGGLVPARLQIEILQLSDRYTAPWGGRSGATGVERHEWRLHWARTNCIGCGDAQ